MPKKHVNNFFLIRQPQSHRTPTMSNQQIFASRQYNKWFFGLKTHIGVDTRTGLTHSLNMTIANLHDGPSILPIVALYFSAFGYRGAQNPEKLKSVKSGWFVWIIFR